MLSLLQPEGLDACVELKAFLLLQLLILAVQFKLSSILYFNFEISESPISFNWGICFGSLLWCSITP